jgi:hypothetical protein
MLSKKSFGGNKRNFLKLLMRFVRSDVSLLRKTTADLRIDTKEHRNGGQSPSHAPRRNSGAA